METTKHIMTLVIPLLLAAAPAQAMARAKVIARSVAGAIISIVTAAAV